MKKLMRNIVAVVAMVLILEILPSHLVMAKPIEVTPHIFVDEVPSEDWYLNNTKSIIFAGYGSPIFPNQKSHYIDVKSIQYGQMKDGRLVIKCNFNNMYEFACFYQDKNDEGSYRARFMMVDTINGNLNAFEVDSILANFNAQNIEPFPQLGTNIIPARVVEMLYFIVKGEKYYGDLNPKLFVNTSASETNDIINPYTQDLYDRCSVIRKK